MNLLLEKFQPQIAIPDEVILGLTSPHKMLPTHLLYDAEGSDLFDRICQTEDYYLTRTEESILSENAGDIAQRNSNPTRHDMMVRGERLPKPPRDLKSNE